MYYNQVPMLTHWRHMHDRESFVDAQATRQEDMTGIWRGNDGSVYYIRHDAPHVWWAGFSDNGGGRTWTHVFHGMFVFDYETGSYVISGNWVDVPRGTNRNTGTLVVARSGDRLTKVAGGTGTTTWERLRW